MGGGVYLCIRNEEITSTTNQNQLNEKYLLTVKTIKIMTPIINSQLPEFKVQAYHNGEFKTVSHEDVLDRKSTRLNSSH